MILFNPWGLLGLLALPAIVAIHLFRRRFRPQPVSGLFLYGPHVRTIDAGRKRQRLLWCASLFCELLAALALTWYFTDPHLSSREQAKHLVVVLDNRLRIAALTSDGSSVDARLRQTLDERLAKLDRDDRVTVIASGTPPRLLAGPEARPARAREAIAEWKPSDPWHELAEALTLAHALSDQEAMLLIASDRADADLPASVGFIARGQALPASGLTDVRWLNDTDGERIVARVLAQGGGARRTLELRSAGQVLARRELTLVSDQPQAVILPVPAGIGSTAQLLLTGADPLPFDDSAVLQRPERGAIRVRMTAKGPEAEAFTRACAALHDVIVDHDGLAAAHLLVSDHDELPPAGTWLVRVTAGHAKPVLGPFLARRGHPLLSDLDFNGALWSGGVTTQELAATPTASALLEAGDTVLISEEHRGRERRFTLHLSANGSTLMRHPAWPGLVANLIAVRRAALPGCRSINLPVGQPTIAVLPPGRSNLTINDPLGGSTRLIANGDGDVLIPGLPHAGLHRLELSGPDGVQPWRELTVLALDARLGNLTAASSSDREPAVSAITAVERTRSRLAHLLPIVLAAAIALSGWWWFRREEGHAP